MEGEGGEGEKGRRVRKEGYGGKGGSECYGGRKVPSAKERKEQTRETEGVTNL
jgi:hypothetical protein